MKSFKIYGSSRSTATSATVETNKTYYFYVVESNPSMYKKSSRVFAR